MEMRLLEHEIIKRWKSCIFLFPLLLPTAGFLNICPNHCPGMEQMMEDVLAFVAEPNSDCKPGYFPATEKKESGAVSECCHPCSCVCDCFGQTEPKIYCDRVHCKICLHNKDFRCLFLNGIRNEGKKFGNLTEDEWSMLLTNHIQASQPPFTVEDHVNLQRRPDTKIVVLVSSLIVVGLAILLSMVCGIWILRTRSKPGPTNYHSLESRPMLLDAPDLNNLPPLKLKDSAWIIAVVSAWEKECTSYGRVPNPKDFLPYLVPTDNPVITDGEKKQIEAIVNPTESFTKLCRLMEGKPLESLQIAGVYIHDGGPEVIGETLELLAKRAILFKESGESTDVQGGTYPVNRSGRSVKSFRDHIRQSHETRPRSESSVQLKVQKEQKLIGADQKQDSMDTASTSVLDLKNEAAESSGGGS